MNYKFSNYNVIVPKDDMYILFNTRTLSLGTLTDKEATMFLSKNIKQLLTLDKEEIFNLIDNGFIIPSDVSEIDIIKKEYWRNKVNNDILHLTIMTTLECNFGCVYCFEKRKSISLSENSQQRILNFIKNNIGGYKALHVDWYGGEPLLNLKSIKELSQEIIKFCNEKKIEYFATTTTNGYRLTANVVDELKNMQVKAAQITLDGPKDIHDSRRMLLNGSGTFETIIKNIKYASKHMSINIRVNVDINTINSVKSLLYYLKENELLNINIAIKGVVSAEANPCKETEIPEHEFAKEVIKLYKDAQEMGFSTPISNMLNNQTRNFCIVDLDSQYIISPEGELFKCGESFEENDPGRIGKITDDGKSELYGYNYSLWNKDPFEQTECKECKVLPICMGGCRMKKVIKKTGWCSPELKYCLSDMISMYYENIS